MARKSKATQALQSVEPELQEEEWDEEEESEAFDIDYPWQFEWANNLKTNE